MPSHARTGPGRRPQDATGWGLLAVVVVLAVAALAGLWLLRPGPVDAQPTGERVLPAVVVAAGCTAAGPCAGVQVRLGDGSTVPLDSGPETTAPQLRVGDRVLVTTAAQPPEGQPATYAFSDYERGRPLAVLALAFAVVVVLVARWRGVAALVGLALTWLVLRGFLVPALLDGRAALPVAVVASVVIVVPVLYLAHGVSVRTTTALLGTLLALGLTAGLGALCTTAARLSGASSDEATYLRTLVGQVDLRGLVLAGLVIGSLGLLNDLTISQSSTAWELAAADPAASWREVYRRTMRVGRDHLSSAVYTIVFAYAGASLPLLLLLTVTDQPLARTLTGDAVGEEVVRTLVGGIGLAAAVPLTTVAAAVLATGGAAARRGTDGTGHRH